MFSHLILLCVHLYELVRITILMYIIVLLFAFRGQYVVYQGGGDSLKISIEDRVWENNEFNFDDVAKAMLSLCTVSTFEGWPR